MHSRGRGSGWDLAKSAGRSVRITCGAPPLPNSLHPVVAIGMRPSGRPRMDVALTGLPYWNRADSLEAACPWRCSR